MKYFIVSAAVLFCSQASYAASTLSIDKISDSGNRSSVFGSFDEDYSADSSGFRVRWGNESIEDSRLEFYFSQYDVDKEGRFSNNSEWDLGVNKVITFSSESLVPFFKIGAGIGQADTDTEFVTATGDNTDNIGNVHFNIGVGMSYRIIDSVAITGGLDITYRKWQDVIDYLDF